MGKKETLLRAMGCLLWRAEVEELQFRMVVDVLECLGHLEEVEVSSIEDEIKELFPRTAPMEYGAANPFGEEARA